MSNIIDSIQLSGVTYTIQGSGGGGNPTVELTQAQYDALVTAGTVSADTYYIITDAQGGDLSNYMTSAQTMSAITQAVSGKANSSDVYLKSETSGATEISTALANKQTTLTAGTGIDITDNVISVTGGGSITVDSALDSGSTNPVENQALWDELRIPKNEEVETVLEWENNDEGITTNYPSGVATKLEFYVDESQMTENGYGFWGSSDWEELGNINIVVSNGNISVTNYENVTYSISGNVVTVEYPTIAAEVTKIYSYYSQFWTVKAYTGGIVYEPIIDQVTANTTALGGLKLVKLSQSAYDALSPNYDSNTLYVIVN